MVPKKAQNNPDIFIFIKKDVNSEKIHKIVKGGSIYIYTNLDKI